MRIYIDGITWEGEELVFFFFSRSGIHPDRRYRVSSGEPSDRDDQSLHHNLRCKGTS